MSAVRQPYSPRRDRRGSPAHLIKKVLSSLGHPGEAPLNKGPASVHGTKRTSALRRWASKRSSSFGFSINISSMNFVAATWRRVASNRSFLPAIQNPWYGTRMEESSLKGVPRQTGWTPAARHWRCTSAGVSKVIAHASRSHPGRSLDGPHSDGGDLSFRAGMVSARRSIFPLARLGWWWSMHSAGPRRRHATQQWMRSAWGSPCSAVSVHLL